MTCSIFDELQADWDRLARSAKSRSALASWAESESELTRFSDLNDLQSFTRTGEPPEVDRVLLALVRVAAADALAAQVVLCLLLPGCRAIARRLAWVDADRREVATATVAAAYGRIRQYPVDRRPRFVALNLVLDTAKDVRRGRAGPAALVADPDAYGTDRSPEPSASDELLTLLATALREGILDRDQARLVAAVRILDVRVEDLARAAGIHPGSMRRHRHAAEQRLSRLAA